MMGRQPANQGELLKGLVTEDDRVEEMGSRLPDTSHPQVAGGNVPGCRLEYRKQRRNSY